MAENARPAETLTLPGVRFGVDRTPHYVRHNQQSRIPRRHIVIDTLDSSTPVAGGSVRRWKLGVTVGWFGRKGRKPQRESAQHDTPQSMWEWIDARTTQRERTVVWAHNVGWDVRIADALRILPQLGWELEAHNLAPRGTWLVWRRDGANLTIVDSASIWADSLGDVAKMFGLGKVYGKPGNPDAASTVEACQRNAEIIAHAVETYLQWLEDDDMGNWQITGAGQSWAHYRHRHMSTRLLVHDDPDAIALERRAMWTGRCEAYWHGTWNREVVHEWDMTAAYAHVSRDMAVPVRLVGPIPRRYPWRRVLERPDLSMCARVQITTALPVVPTQYEGRIVWPVGRFSTVLWDDEISEALDAGAKVEVLNGYLYHAEPALKDWATWILAQLAAPDAIVPAWRKKIVKQWGRSLIGRFGMTYTPWETIGDAPELATDRRPWVDYETGETGEIMRIGHRVMMSGERIEWDQSMPAITGAVMAACRTRLWRIMRRCAPETVLYCDTDSLICHDSRSGDVAAAANGPDGEGLRLKRSWDGIAIYGPRQIVTGPRVRMSGVPVTARAQEDGTFRGEVWDSPATGIGRGEVDSVRAQERVWRPRRHDHRRASNGIGWTEPLHIWE